MKNRLNRSTRLRQQAKIQIQEALAQIVFDAKEDWEEMRFFFQDDYWPDDNWSDAYIL